MINQVGKVAWDKSRNQDINFLTERLNIIESQATENKELDEDFFGYFN